MTVLPFAQSDGLVVQELDGEVMVYNLETDQVSCLNELAAFVWERCDGKSTVADVVADSDGRLSSDAVGLALHELHAMGLVRGPSPVTGLSRRQLLLRFGSAAVALPIVSTLVAPTPASAQSSGVCPPGFANCDNNSATGVNGCETNITTTQNCGGCGIACSGGAICLYGICLVP